MVPDMKEIGKMTYNMDLDLNNGLINQAMKDIIKKVRSMGRALIYGVMVQNTRVTGTTIR